MNVPQVVTGAPQQFTLLRGKDKKEVFLFEVLLVCYVLPTVHIPLTSWYDMYLHTHVQYMPIALLLLHTVR